MVVNFLNQLSESFWSSDVWLPPGVTWKDLEPNDQNPIAYPRFSDIWYPVLFSFALTFLRLLFEKYVFFPLGIANGLRPVRPWKGQAPDNPVLEKAFLVARKGRLNYKQIQGLAKQLDWTERQVERWIRMRRMMDRPSTLVKFMECGWRFSYYGFAFGYGVWTLWDKDWFWDINHCWYTFPHQGVTNDIWWYYMMELSFYWSLLFSMFEDIKRKDFLEMLIHHFVTIILLVLSWTCNLIRAGTLVLVIHDCADIFLEMAKMMKYIKWQRTCDALFAIFTVTWIGTRLVIYPYWFLYSTCIGAKEIVPMFPAYYIFNSLLLLLLVLHIIWTYFILKVLYRAILSGQMEKDSRSSSSEDFSEDNSKSGNSSATPTTPSKRLPAKSGSHSREHKNSK